MAVKQHVTESEQDTNPETNKIIYEITEVIEIINQVRTENSDFSDLRKIDDLCKTIVLHLGNVQIPGQGIKQFEEQIGDVKKFLRNYLLYVFEKDNNCNEIVSGWLKILYLLISNGSNKEPVSAAIAIVLEIFVEIDEHHVTNAVNWILSTDKSTDFMIVKAVTLLCTWLRTITFAPKLNLWINEFYSCLRNQQRYNLLTRISADNILNLFRTLMIPIFREKVAPVVILILQTSQISFHIIAPIVPTILRILDNEYYKNVKLNNSTIAQQLIQKVIDVIAMLIIAFPEHVQLYDTIKLKCFTLSKHIPISTSWNSKLHPIIANTNARVGLVNLGNTCYMNSVLQSLVMTKQFSREILLSTVQTPLLAKVQKLLALMLHSSRPELTPRDFLHAARPPGFLPGHQQDSSEFLGYLLETLHDQEKNYNENQSKILIKSINLKRPNPDQDIGPNDDITNDDDTIENEEVDRNSSVGRGDDGGGVGGGGDGDCDGVEQVGAQIWNKDLMDIDNKICSNINGKSSNQIIKNSILDNTFVQKSFGGRISITHKCLTCNSESRTIDLFRDLQLSFPEYQNSNTNYNVQYLLDCYCRSEKLIDDNKYSCDKCKTLSDGERYINIINAPKNLILTLKYFKYDQKYHTRSKLMHKIELNDVIFLKLDNQTIKYGLYAAVVHSGVSMDSGHYYTYAADTPQTWYKFNDSFVSNTTIDDLQNLKPPNTPYILFYQVLGNDHGHHHHHHHHNSAQQNEPSQEQCNTTLLLPDTNEVRLPQLGELPPHLRELVNNDNVSYREEITGRRQTKDSIRI